MSIVLYLTGGPDGTTRQSLEKTLWGEETDRFWYYAFGLEKCLAEEWVGRPQPLAAALAALMRSQTWSRVEQKLHCLRAIARADVDEERLFLLVNLVETYLNLTGPEAQRYAELVALEDNEEVREMELTWAGKIQKEYYELGLRQGRVQGHDQSLEQAELQGARQLALGLLWKRFGSLPAVTVQKVESMEATELRRLRDRLLEAETLGELGLD